MPLFEYECTECKYEEEQLVSFSVAEKQFIIALDVTRKILSRRKLVPQAGSF